MTKTGFPSAFLLILLSSFGATGCGSSVDTSKQTTAPAEPDPSPVDTVPSADPDASTDNVSVDNDSGSKAPRLGDCDQSTPALSSKYQREVSLLVPNLPDSKKNCPSLPCESTECCYAYGGGNPDRGVCIPK